MKTRFPAAVLAIAGLVAVVAPARSADPQPGTRNIELSTPTLELLRQEMQLIAGDMQNLAGAISTGDWHAIREAGRRIGDSYVMAQRLTPSQAAELEAALPARFKALDAEFHARAARLSVAAGEHDIELVIFHYARLLEGCAACHAGFAADRFDGFSAREPRTHGH